MTDKEKRELKDGIISIFKNFNTLDRTATIGGLRNDILSYINSLQEEPKPKFHIGDTIRHRKEKDSFKVLAIEDDCYKLENNIVVSIAAQDNWEVVEEPTPHYPKSKEASGTLKKMLDNITEESLEKARKQLKEKYVSKDLEEVVKDLWQEINTGHQYSILDSYNQFYGMCLDVCDWQKKQTISKAISWLQSNIDCDMWSKEFRKILED